MLLDWRHVFMLFAALKEARRVQPVGQAEIEQAIKGREYAANS